MTASEITNAVVQCLYPPRQYTVVPNVSWALVPWGEMDLAVVTKAGYLIEVEVKISAGDLRRDRYKDKWKPFWAEARQSIVRSFYFAVPVGLKDAALAVPDAGVIVVGEGGWAHRERRAKINAAATALTPDKLTALHRAVNIRYWNGRLNLGKE